MGYHQSYKFPKGAQDLRDTIPNTNSTTISLRDKKKVCLNLALIAKKIVYRLFVGFIQG